MNDVEMDEEMPLAGAPYEYDISSDEEDDDFGKPILCNGRLKDMFIYLSYVSRIDEREQLEAFQSLNFRTRCPCCFEKFGFGIQRNFDEELKCPYFELFVVEPNSRVHIAKKPFGKPIDFDVIVTFWP